MLRGESQGEQGVTGIARGSLWLEILHEARTAALTLQKLSLQQSLPEAAPEVK